MEGTDHMGLSRPSFKDCGLYSEGNSKRHGSPDQESGAI